MIINTLKTLRAAIPMKNDADNELAVGWRSINGENYTEVCEVMSSADAHTDNPFQPALDALEASGLDIAIPHPLVTFGYSEVAVGRYFLIPETITIEEPVAQ